MFTSQIVLFHKKHTSATASRDHLSPQSSQACKVLWSVSILQYSSEQFWLRTVFWHGATLEMKLCEWELCWAKSKSRKVWQWLCLFQSPQCINLIDINALITVELCQLKSSVLLHQENHKMKPLCLAEMISLTNALRTYCHGKKKL